MSLFFFFFLGYLPVGRSWLAMTLDGALLELFIWAIIRYTNIMIDTFALKLILISTLAFGSEYPSGTVHIPYMFELFWGGMGGIIKLNNDQACRILYTCIWTSTEVHKTRVKLLVKAHWNICNIVLHKWMHYYYYLPYISITHRSCFVARVSDVSPIISEHPGWIRALRHISSDNSDSVILNEHIVLCEHQVYSLLQSVNVG